MKCERRQKAEKGGAETGALLCRQQSANHSEHALAVLQNGIGYRGLHEVNSRRGLSKSTSGVPTRGDFQPAAARKLNPDSCFFDPAVAFRCRIRKIVDDGSLDLCFVDALYFGGMRARRLFGVQIPILYCARGTLHADVARTGARIRGGGRGFSLQGRMAVFSGSHGIGRESLAMEPKRSAQDVAVAVPRPGDQLAKWPIDRHPLE